MRSTIRIPKSRPRRGGLAPAPLALVPLAPAPLVIAITTLALSAGALPVAPAAGAARERSIVTAPSFAPGDSWTYEDTKEVRGTRRATHDTSTVTRVEGGLLRMSIRSSAPNAVEREVLAQPDWSRVRSVNGRQTVVNRPFAFPLKTGKSWIVDFTEDAPSDRRHLRERLDITYRVTGWEDVTVPAGTFHALHIQGDGTWTAELPANTVVASGRTQGGGSVAVSSQQAARIVSGRFLKSFWYVPAVRRWVRSEENYYDNNGVATEQNTSMLEAFTPADAPGRDDAADRP